jgi:hypothetical protein
MTTRALPLLLLGLAAGLAAAAPAAAQTRWLQTVEVIAPVDEHRPTGALLDSLVQVAERGRVPVRREPDGADQSFAALEDQLLNDGLDFTSANRVFLNYRLEATQRGFTSEIESFFFIYRPDGADGLDIPILYVDGHDPAVAELLMNGGMRLETNEAAMEPFYEQVTFHRLRDATVVAVGGRVIRDEARAEAERRRLLAAVQQFIY